MNTPSFHASAPSRLPVRPTPRSARSLGSTPNPWRSWVLAGLLGPLSALAPPAALAADRPASPSLQTLRVASSSQPDFNSRDAVVEAVRQTVVAAQVAGAIVQVEVKAGDRVTAGQVLMRIDARQAEQSAQASEAQAQAARAQGLLAAREFERQQQLFRQNYISQAALDQAEAQYKASQAQVQAQLAQLGVARTQSGFNTVRSPYAGVVADVPVTLGDMALPGRALATVYDPSALRISTHIPQSLAAQLQAAPAGAGAQSQIRIDLPALGAAGIGLKAGQVQILPTVDPATLTQEMRLSLPTSLAGQSAVVPGMFARVHWPSAWSAQTSPAAERAPALTVPRQALVRRAELVAVYVLDAQGQPLLRQLRLGRSFGEHHEVLSGLSAGEQVVLNPQAAASQR